MSDLAYWLLLHVAVLSRFPTGSSTVQLLGDSGAPLPQMSWNTSMHVQYLEFSLEWEIALVSEYLFTYKSVCSDCRQRCLLLPFVQSCENSVFEGNGKKSEISVSKAYCTFGSLSWCL